MKLLFDQNLSFRLCGRLHDIFPGSAQVSSIGMATATDIAIWQYAKAQGLMLVSLDADFAELAALLGPPPKVVWLRRGNRSTSEIEQVLREHVDTLAAFEADAAAACLELY
jgi:predicted nuclease of predicted toxin-antitoxin system